MLSEKFLAEIRAEIAEREMELEEWRELERLTARLGAEGPRLMRREPTKPNPSERAPHAARRRADFSVLRARRPRGGIEERKQAILEALSAQGPLSPRALAKIVGADVRGDLRKLRNAGKVNASGSTSCRTYTLARNGDKPGQPDPPPLSPRVAKLEAQAQANGNGDQHHQEIEDQLLAVLRRVGGRVAISELAYQLRRHGHERGAIDGAAGRLVTHGLAIRDQDGGLRLAPIAPNGERPLEEAILDAAGVDEL